MLIIYEYSSHCLGSRNPQEKQAEVDTLDLKVSIKEIAAENDIIVLAVPYSAIKDVIAEIKNDVNNKIIIDAGDNTNAKLIVAELVSDAGFVPVDIGRLAESAPLDPGGILFPQVFTPADMKLTLKRK